MQTMEEVQLVNGQNAGSVGHPLLNLIGCHGIIERLELIHFVLGAEWLGGVWTPPRSKRNAPTQRAQRIGLLPSLDWREVVE